MPALDTSQVDQGSELAARWQQLAQEWAKWWMTSALPQSAPPHHTSANSAQRVTPLFDSRAIAELTERFAPRFQALWTRVMSGSATLPSKATASSERDRRFAAPAWRDQPYYKWPERAGDDFPACRPRYVRHEEVPRERGEIRR